MKNKFLFKILLTFFVIILISCPAPTRDNPNDPKSEDYTITYDVLAPSANVGTITGNESIKIQFSDSMNRISVVITGDLSTADKVWSTSTLTDDTLELTPNSSDEIWLGGTYGADIATAKSIIINGQSENGISISQITLNYEVFYGVFVATTGNDSNPGTIDEPLLTLPAGISEAKTVYKDSALSANSAVRVKTGDYTTNWATSTNRIIMEDSISIYGGYNTTYSERDRDSNPTTITDESSSGGSDETTSINRTIDCGAGITNNTIINGFIIYGGSGVTDTSYSTAISCQNSSSPYIENNKITGGSPHDTSLGILVNNSSPIIVNNIINGGSGDDISSGLYIIGLNNSYEIEENNINGGSATISRGLWIRNVTSNSIVIKKNRVTGGSGTSNSIGIYLDTVTTVSVINNLIFGGLSATSITGLHLITALPDIYNNTIICGDLSKAPGGVSYIIRLVSSASPDIDNNILIGAQGSGTYEIYGLYEDSVGEEPNSFDNNLIFNLDASNTLFELYIDDNNTGSPLDITGINLKTFAESNIDTLNPNFSDIDGEDDTLSSMDDNNWNLTSSTNTSISEGGKSGLGFTDDFDDNTRTIPWSIGAFEYNN